MYVIVVGAFPDGQSCLNLAAARLRYIAGTAWSAKCYMNMRLLDQPQVPLRVVEYVMYHEMLHIRHQSCIQDCRIVVHTTEFRANERRFSEYRNAKLWLKRL